MINVSDLIRSVGEVEADVVADAAEDDGADRSCSNDDSDLQNRPFFLLLDFTIFVYLEQVCVEESCVESGVVARHHRHGLGDAIELFVTLLA